jgi:SAM-dependent methyltransferase
LNSVQPKKYSTKDIFADRSRYGGLRAVIDPNDNIGRRNYYLDILSSSLIKRKIPSHTGRVLDFGCGNGRIAKAIAQSNVDEIWGVDITPSLIEEAEGIPSNRKRKVFHFKVIEQAPPYPLEKEYFDMVICCWVLQHINNDNVVREVFKELFRVLKRGGTLVTFDRTSAVRCVQHLNDEPYTTIRTIAEEEMLANEAGFQLESTRIVWIVGRFWQRVLNRFNWSIWWPFIPFMVWWDLHFCNHPFPKEGERAECLYTMKKSK